MNDPRSPRRTDLLGRRRRLGATRRAMAAGIGLRVDQVAEIEDGTESDALRNLYWMIAHQRGTIAEAEACYLTAIEIAQAQQGKAYELRASMSLARLWRNEGRTAEAHRLLATIYGWFTEGFDTIDLKEAKTLLDELGGLPETACALHAIGKGGVDA